MVGFIVVALGLTWSVSQPATSLEANPSTATSRVDLESSSLTFESTLLRAWEHAPALVRARSAVTQTERQRDAAGVWRANPTVSAVAGPRWLDDAANTRARAQWSIGWSQPFDLSRRARFDAGQASVGVRSADLDDVARHVAHDVGLAFVDVLYWQHRMTLATDQLALAETVVEVTRARQTLGDAAGFDVSRAALWRAQLTAERAQAVAAHTRAIADLQAQIGGEVTAEVVVVGELAAFADATVDAMSGEADGDLHQRSDVRAAATRVEAERARVRLADTARRPGLALGARVGREGDEAMVLGTAAITLPLFDRGQGDRAVARAGADAAETELALVRRQAQLEQGREASVHAELRRALAAFERDALAEVSRMEQNAVASYRAGALGLGELLEFRREWMTTRLTHADLALAAARARIEWCAAADAWPGGPFNRSTTIRKHD